MDSLSQSSRMPSSCSPGTVKLFPPQSADQCWAVLWTDTTPCSGCVCWRTCIADPRHQYVMGPILSDWSLLCLGRTFLHTGSSCDWAWQCYGRLWPVSKCASVCQTGPTSLLSGHLTGRSWLWTWQLDSLVGATELVMGDSGEVRLEDNALERLHSIRWTVVATWSTGVPVWECAGSRWHCLSSCHG